MANDRYTIVIVPHGDPAAQALTKARVASIVHASRQPPPPHAKAAAASHAAASKSGSARPKRGGGAPKSGPRGVHAGQRIRSWSVVVGNDKYDVTDFGTTCGYKIGESGTIVWTGVRSGQGYTTHTTTLPADRLREVLRLAYVGDQREAAKAGRPASPSSTPSDTEPKSRSRPKRRAPARPPAAARAKPKAEGSAPAAKPAPSAKPTEKPKAKRAAKAKPSAPASPRAEHGAKPKAKGPAKRKAASSRSGPSTQRTPVLPPSATAHAPATPPRVSDRTVLDALRKKFREEDPAAAEQNFATFRRIWLGGGREATVEWMRLYTFSSAVDAFIDWTNKHFETAQAMLAKAPPSAPKRAKVA